MFFLGTFSPLDVLSTTFSILLWSLYKQPSPDTAKLLTPSVTKPVFIPFSLTGLAIETLDFYNFVEVFLEF
jgi:hypothetical protein